MTMATLPRPAPGELTSRSEALSRITTKVSSLALEYFHNRGSLKIEEKSALDYVSNADHAVERKLRELILVEFPDDNVIGEELGGLSSSAYWIIDPIDGTSNFLSGLPLWGISVAYVVNGEPVIGAIAMPALDQIVCGDIERGLDTASSAQKQNQLTPRVFGVGRNGDWDVADRTSAERAVENAGLYPVNMGSCSVMLAFCVLGKMAGYVEAGIGFWDCAGGVALCKASGIEVAFLDGAETGLASVVCGPLTRHAEFLKYAALNNQVDWQH